MKHLFSFIAFYSIVILCHAQDQTYYNRMEQMFGAIEKNKVTTGLLKDFGIRYNSVEAFNGVLVDSNYVDMTQWQSLYTSLSSMRIGTATSIFRKLYQTDTITNKSFN